MDSLMGDLTTSQVARILGVSPSLVRTWTVSMNWDVHRDAQGHRVFSPADLARLRELKSWLDDGNHLKEFRQIAYGGGDYDPRIELKANFRRVKELLSQYESVLVRQQALLGSFDEAGKDWLARLTAIGAEVTHRDDSEPAIPQVPQVPTAEVVEGVLRQLLCETLARQGKLSLLGEYRDGDKVWKRYATVDGRQQVVQEWCGDPRTRSLFDTVVQVLGSPGQPGV